MARTLFWLRQVVFPLPILLGVFIPMDMVSTVLLAPFYLLGFFWGLGLFRCLLLWLRKKPLDWRQCARPVLSIVLLCFTFTSIAATNREVEAEFKAIATAIQLQCVEDSECPVSPKNWPEQKAHQSHYETRIGRLNHRLMYFRSEDGLTFSLVIRKNIDGRDYADGGAKTELRFRSKRG
jgi:hypothetical protein